MLYIYKLLPVLLLTKSTHQIKGNQYLQSKNFRVISTLLIVRIAQNTEFSELACFLKLGACHYQYAFSVSSGFYEKGDY